MSLDITLGINVRSACELDGAFGGDPSSKSSSVGAFRLHLIVTEVVPIAGGADGGKKSFCAVQYLSEGLTRVWSLVLPVCSLLWNPGILLAWFVFCLLEVVLRTVQLAWLVLAPHPPYKRKRGIFVCISPVGWGGLVYGAYWWHGLVSRSVSHPQWSVQPGIGSVWVSWCLPDCGDPIWWTHTQGWIWLGIGRLCLELQSWGQFLRFLLKKPRVELALLAMLLMCMCHLRSDKNWTPRMARYQLLGTCLGTVKMCHH